MARRTVRQIGSKVELAKKVIQHHFGSSLHNIEFKPTGLTNYVFDIRTAEGSFIVRIGSSPGKFDDFLKEQWATEKALEKGVPVPEILEVGNQVIDYPYMLQKKCDGKEATDHPDRYRILSQLGKYARLIHTIPTTGFGDVFDWSRNKLSKKRTWTEYLDDELQVSERIAFLRRHRLLTDPKLGLLTEFVDKIRGWKPKPSLNHCDLRLKNVIVDRKGEIIALIDWDNCASHVAPYWDLSIALHDLSIDGKQMFLEGYGIDGAAFRRRAYALTVFNVLNYVPALHTLLGDRRQLDLYKLRLNGALDLFSL